MGTKQECFRLFCTNLGSNTPRKNKYTTTYFLSFKKSKLNEQDLRNIAGETRTIL